jgi:hypothetical protein
MRSTTTACNSAAIACAPVHEGAPMLTISPAILAPLPSVKLRAHKLLINIFFIDFSKYVSGSLEPVLVAVIIFVLQALKSIVFVPAEMPNLIY